MKKIKLLAKLGGGQFKALYTRLYTFRGLNNIGDNWYSRSNDFTKFD